MSMTNPITQFRAELVAMTPELSNALPSHIKPEKFQRVVLTVVQLQPDLLKCDRRSLFGACIKCAADGLIPDGREAALVIFNTKNKDGGWEKKVQYMPMLTGILKRARNSDEIAGVVVNIVHENDEFIQAPDDFDRPIQHRPPKLGEDRGSMIGAYALVKLKDGTVMHEVMDRSEIDRVAAVSRSRDKQGNLTGPWKDWYDQMARKTVFRRLSKWLPLDADADAIMRRDDELGATTVAEPAGPMLEGEVHAPDSFEQAASGIAGEILTEDGEVIPAGGVETAEAPGDAIIAEFRALPTFNDILATEKNGAVKAAIAKLPEVEQQRVKDEIEAMKELRRMGA